MTSDNKEIERAYWNLRENTEGYEENNFTIFTDPQAQKKVFGHLDKILCNPEHIVADLGCGPGHILLYLSRLCKKIIKIDYAENMLEEAKKRNPYLANIVYEWGDMRDLGNWYDEFDIAIATNSILPNSILDADKMMVEIFKSLKEGGVFVAIMPSIETVTWLARLQFDSCIEEGLSEEDAKEKIRSEFKEKAFDGLFGFVRDGQHNMVQKYFFRDELKYMFEKTGFDILSMDKLCYSWEHCRKYDYGYFPGKDEIYDWLVIAKKPDSDSLSQTNN